MTTLDQGLADGRADRPARLARWIRTVHLLLFLTSVPPIVYLLAWQRALFGAVVDVETVVSTVAVFAPALGLGGLAGGRLATRGSAPLPLLATVALVSGTYGLALWPVLAIDSPPMAIDVVAFALAVIPTALIGAALPRLIGDLALRCGRVGHALGLVSCMSLLGAALGCVVGSALLLRLVGLPGTLAAAIAIDAAVALRALAAHRRTRDDPLFAALAAPRLVRKPVLQFAPLLSLAALGGFVALACEILFFRTVSLELESSGIAFAVTASAVLAGLASGARQAAGCCALLSRDGIMRRAIAAVMKANLLGLLFLPLLTHLNWLDRGVVAAAVVMVYLVARLWGAVLPYLAELGIAADHAAGARSALAICAHGLGATMGAVFAGLALTQLGLAATAALLAMAGLACAVVLIGALAMPGPEKILRTGLAAALGVVALAVSPLASPDAIAHLQWLSKPAAAQSSQPTEDASVTKASATAAPRPGGLE
jgi:hypothetical protein